MSAVWPQFDLTKCLIDWAALDGKVLAITVREGCVIGRDERGVLYVLAITEPAPPVSGGAG